MEFLFGILEQLATSLSPTQFLGVMVLIVASVVFTIKLVAKKKKGGGGLIAFLTGAGAGLTEEHKLNGIEKKVDQISDFMHSLSTTLALENFADKILAELDSLKDKAIVTEQQFEKQLEHINEMKRDAKELTEMLTAEISDIKHHMKMHDNQVHQDSEATKELQNRMHGILSRMISQLEKIDEFAKATVPEFRSYNKDISKEINSLSRDIALVERSIQNQINTSSSVRLR